MDGTQAATSHLVAYGEVNGWAVASGLMMMLLLSLGCGSEPVSAPPVEAAPPGSSEPPQGVPIEEPSGGLPELFRREVALAALEDRDPAPDVVEVELEARVSQVELAPGHVVEAWTYNGVMPGPTIRARAGDLVRVHFENKLPESTTIHWHGLEVPADQDGAGHEQAEIAAGGRFDFAFRVPHAGTYWYHPHVNSAEQVWRGLYGALIVEDPAEPDLGEELTLVLHDLSYDEATGQILPAAEHGDLGRYFGHEGSTLLVNGRVLPTLRAHPGSTLRLRVINAAISRYFRFGVEGHQLTRVAGDSGRIERSETVEDVVLAPGERSELVVSLQGAAGDRIRVRALPYDRFECGGCGEAQELMTVELAAGVGRTVTVPEGELALIEPIDLSTATTRELELSDVTREGVTYLAINGHVDGQDGLVLQARVGETEIWEVHNRTQYDHPFHLHGFRFQVLDRAGEPPAIREWKDTLNIPAMASARIAVRYDDRPGMWMFHCHILDHAEIGMMAMLHLMGAEAEPSHQH